MSTATAPHVHTSRGVLVALAVAIAIVAIVVAVVLANAGPDTTRSAPLPTAAASVRPDESDVANAVTHHSNTLPTSCIDSAIAGHC